MNHFTYPKFAHIGNWLLAAALVSSLVWGAAPPAAAQSLVPAAARAVHRYVSPAGADAGDCTLSTAPCATIQYALGQALTGDEVQVATGIYSQMNAYGGLAQIVYLDKDVDLTGGYSPNFALWDPQTYTTTLEAGGQGRGVYATGNISSTLSGLFITHGDAAGLGGGPGMSYDLGGGVYVRGGATLLISACQVISNTAYGGGGVAVFQGTLRVENSTLAKNYAATGSAVSAVLGQTHLQHNEIVENDAHQGGSVMLDYSTASLSENTISRNTESMGVSGGVWISDGPATLRRNTISDNDWAGVWLSQSNTLLDQNTITGNGFGVFCSSLCDHSLLRDNTITNNSGASNSGGGIHIESSQYVTITGNTITGNAGSGGISLLFADEVNIAHNLIAENSAEEHGGGLFLHSSDRLTLTDNILRDNQAGGNGGGLYLDSFNPDNFTLSDNTLTGNQAGGNGGGLYWNYGNPRLVNNLIADNVAGGSGSGAYITNSHPHFIHTTLAHNTGGEGSGITTASSLQMTNTILVEQSVGLLIGASATARLDSTLWHGNGQDWEGSGLVTATHNYAGAPGFVNAAIGDYHLTASSPARDAGLDAGVYTDFEGEARPLGSGFDLGYDEAQVFSIDLSVHKTHTPQRLRPGDPLTFTLSLANYGTTTATQVLLSDILPPEFTPGGVASNLTITFTGGTPYTWQIAPLLPGRQGTITLTGWIDAAVLPGTTFTNTASITTTLPLVPPTPFNDVARDAVHVNAPPVATRDAYTTTEDAPLAVAAPGFLGNDFDAEGDEMSFVLDPNPIAGTLELGAQGAFTYTPPADFGGVVTFTYHLSDGLDSSASTPVVLTVTPVNDPPQVEAGSNQSISEGQVASFQGSFTDPDSARLLAGEQILWLFGDGASITGTLAPTHPYADDGSFTVTLIVTDSQGAAAGDTLLVSVANTPPALGVLPGQEVLVGQPLTLTVPFSDAGLLDAHVLTITWGDGVTETVSLAAGVFTLEASHTYLVPGDYTVTLTLADEDGGQDRHTLPVSVLPYALYLPLMKK